MTSTQPRPGAASTLIALVLAAVVVIDIAFLLGQPDNSHIDGSLTTQSDELVILALILVGALGAAWWLWKKATSKALTWVIIAMILVGPVLLIIGWVIPALGPIGFFFIVGGGMLCAVGMLFALGEGIGYVIRKVRAG